MREQVVRIQQAKILYDLARAGLLDRQLTEEMAAIWTRLWNEFGGGIIQTALDCHPIATTTMGNGTSLFLIDGETYVFQRAHGARLAEMQWELAKLNDGANPYYACRLANGTLQCDCADWTYRVAESNGATCTHCKHLRALASLGLI